MAITFDAVSTASGNSAGPFTFSHTVGGDFLLVSIAHYDSTDFVSGVTFNGISMTQVSGGNATNGQYWIDLYYMVAPDSGTHTVSVSVTGAVFDIGIAAISFAGVDQSTPLGTAGTATGSSSTPSVNVSSAAGELVVDGLLIVHSGTLTVGASQTSRWNAPTANAFIKYAGSTEAGAATTTMSWANSTSQDWVMAAVPLKPAGAAPSFKPAWAARSNVIIGVA